MTLKCVYEDILLFCMGQDEDMLHLVCGNLVIFLFFIGQGEDMLHCV